MQILTTLFVQQRTLDMRTTTNDIIKDLKTLSVDMHTSGVSDVRTIFEAAQRLEDLSYFYDAVLDSQSTIVEYLSPSSKTRDAQLISYLYDILKNERIMLMVNDLER